MWFVPANPGDTVFTTFRWPRRWRVLWGTQGHQVTVWLVNLNRDVLISKWSLKTDAGRNILRMVQCRMQSFLPPLDVRISLQPWLCLGPHHNLKQFTIQHRRPQRVTIFDLGFLPLFLPSFFLLPNWVSVLPMAPASLLSSQFIFFWHHYHSLDIMWANSAGLPSFLSSCPSVIHLANPDLEKALSFCFSFDFRYHQVSPVACSQLLISILSLFSPLCVTPPITENTLGGPNCSSGSQIHWMAFAQFLNFLQLLTL